MTTELAEEIAAWTARTPAEAHRLASREIRQCQCGHKGRTHASTNSVGVIVPTGTGACGHCNCPTLETKELQ